MRDSGRRALLGAFGFLLLLALWETVGQLELLGKTFAPPTAVVGYVLRGQNAALLLRATLTTMESAGLGLLIGVGTAIGLAALAVLVPPLRGAIGQFGVVVNALPVIALAPVLLATSRGFMPIAAAALAVLFGTLVTTTAGLMSRGHGEHDVFSLFGATRMRRLCLLQFPGALPAIGDALKIAVPAAILGAVIGEWFGAERGIGVLLQSAMYNYQIPLLWSAALISAVASILGYGAAALIEAGARRRYPRPDRFATPAAPANASRPVLPPWIRVLLGAALTVLVIILAWQLWITLGHVNPIVMPAPMDVLLAWMTNRGAVLGATIHTAAVAFGGLLIGVVGGAIFAVLASLTPVLSGAIVPSLLLARSIPVVAIIPVIARILGFNDQTVLAVAAVITFFPAFALTTSGLRAVPPGSEDLFRVNAASRAAEMLRLRLPSAVPHLLTATRISAATSVLGALAAEWLIGTKGLGYLFGQSAFRLAPGLAWSAIIMAMVLAVLLFALAALLERRGRERWT